MRSAREAKNVVDGIRVTFWMLWTTAKAPVCVYFDIAIDGGRSRQRVMSYAAGTCPPQDPLR